MSACEQNMTDDHGELFVEYHDGLIYARSHSEHPPVLLTDLILEKDSRGYCSPVTCDFAQAKHCPATQM